MDSKLEELANGERKLLKRCSLVNWVHNCCLWICNFLETLGTYWEISRFANQNQEQQTKTKRGISWMEWVTGMWEKCGQNLGYSKVKGCSGTAWALMCSYENDPRIIRYLCQRKMKGLAFMNKVKTDGSGLTLCTKIVWDVNCFQIPGINMYCGIQISDLKFTHKHKPHTAADVCNLYPVKSLHFLSRWSRVYLLQWRIEKCQRNIA